MDFFHFRTILGNPLNINTYKKKFSILLNIEEVQMDVDIRLYDMKDAPMTKQHNLLLLEVLVYVQCLYPQLYKQILKYTTGHVFFHTLIKECISCL